jgi:hypothetical protein
MLAVVFELFSTGVGMQQREKRVLKLEARVRRPIARSKVMTEKIK